MHVVARIEKEQFKQFPRHAECAYSDCGEFSGPPGSLMKRFAIAFALLAASFAAAQTTTQPFLAYSNLDQKLFTTCGACGNSGGSGTLASYQQSIVSSITLDGRDSEFYIDAPYGTYANAYWYLKNMDVPTKVPTNIRYSFALYIPAQFQTAMHAIEFASGMRWTDSYMYRFAWQANFGSGKWRVYDPYLAQWVDTGLPLTGIKFGAWNTIVVEGAPNISSKSTKNLAITVNGVRKTTTTITHARKESSNRPYLVNAFQLDSNKTGQAYSVYVDKMNLQLY